jgi:hypothetical protein
VTLVGRQVNDAGLSKLCELTHLNHLDLSNGSISDTTIKHFLALKELHFLILNGTMVSDQAVKELRSGLPKTTIAFRRTKPTAQAIQARQALQKLGGMIVPQPNGCFGCWPCRTASIEEA